MKRPPSSLQFEQWPPGDRALWAAAFAAGEFLQPTGRAAHWAPATAKQVKKGYAKWLGYLHLSNLLDIDATPSGRVSEDILEGFVLWMKSHDLASTTIASRVTDLHEALRVMKPTTDHTVLSRLIPVLRARETPSQRLREVQWRIGPPCSQGVSPDADHWCAWLLRQSIQPVIPNKENRKQPHAFDSKRYKNRNTIERMFWRLKDYRRIAMRYDKNADNFMAALCLAALICYWI